MGQKFFRYDHDLSCSSRNIFSPFVKYMLRKSRKTEDPDYIKDFQLKDKRENNSNRRKPYRLARNTMNPRMSFEPDVFRRVIADALESLNDFYDILPWTFDVHAQRI